VFVLQFPTFAPVMKSIISEILALISGDVLINVSRVAECRIDVCHVDHGAHIQCL
jgi:hypothetical protein